MNFKVWIKSTFADRVLLPLRKELIALIEEGSTLFDLGCGTGNLLFQSASKISSGYGVDIDRKMIEFAESQKKEHKLNHLHFECIDALQMSLQQFDVSTSTLCLHTVSEQKACDLLSMMVDHSKIVLIADYAGAKSISGKMSIEFDEFISGHYRNYKHYRKSGAIPSYAEKIGAVVQKEIVSVIEGISIWCISKRAIS